ncbi:MAG: hypothetical protein AAGD05_02820 [Bacteroidota bacterium]
MPVLGWNMLFLFVGLLPVVNAQQSALSHPVEGLFEKPQKIQWIKHYKGRLNDLNDVALSLAFDGKQCKGVLTYLRSQEQFDLVGQLKKGKFNLQEFDREAQLSGYLDGELKPEGIIAEWQNHDHRIGGKLQLQEVSKATNVPSHCGENKWIRYYKGVIDRQKVELVLQRESNHQLSGVVYFKTANHSYNVRGHVDLFDNIYLSLKDDYARKQGRMEGTFGERQKFNFTYVAPDGEQSICTFHLKDALQMGCAEYADYMANYNILYPKMHHSAFNQWIEHLSDEWMNNCKSYADGKQAKLAALGPEWRATVRASAWCEIDYWSEELISGLMTFNNNWMPHQTNRTISYDLKNKRAITLVDIFKSDFDYRSFLRKQLNRTIDQHELYKDFDYREWLSKEDFPYFTIRKEGIRFCTKFHPIYGQQQMTISYRELKPFLKSKSPIRTLMK